MGSTGSGRFGNYQIGGGSTGNGQDTPGMGSGGAGNGFGGSDEVKCPQVIENIRLEDVATSEYYSKNTSLPAVQIIVQIRNKVHLGRLAVETVDTHEVIGNLPTQYNYLLNCIKSGYHYHGHVISSGITPIPFVVVTLNV